MKGNNKVKKEWRRMEENGVQALKVDELKGKVEEIRERNIKYMKVLGTESNRHKLEIYHNLPKNANIHY